MNKIQRTLSTITRVSEIEARTPELSAFQKADAYLVDDEPLLYGCGVDGSRLALKCFTTCCNLAKKDDEIYVLHIVVNKTAPIVNQPEHIRLRYEEEARTQAVKMIWMTKEKNEDQSICEALMELVEELQLDFVVLGSYGVTKEAGEEAHVEMKILKNPVMGTTSDALLRTSETSLILTKNTAYQLGDSRTWVMATDNSNSSQTAFALLIRRMVKPGDKVKVVYIGPVKDEAVSLLEMYDAEMSATKIDGQVVHLENHGEQNVGDQIIDFAKTCEADFLMMGIAGFSEAKLGSVSTYVMRTARCTTIIIKDPREVGLRRVNSLRCKSFAH